MGLKWMLKERGRGRKKQQNKNPQANTKAHKTLQDSEQVTLSEGGHLWQIQGEHLFYFIKNLFLKNLIFNVFIGFIGLESILGL